MSDLPPNRLVREGNGGPYLQHPPTAFVIDANGFAWALWPDDTMSMVVSTSANESPAPWRIYTPLTTLERGFESSDREDAEQTPDLQTEHLLHEEGE